LFYLPEIIRLYLGTQPLRATRKLGEGFILASSVELSYFNTDRCKFESS